MKELRKKINAAIIMITHDLGIVSDICDDVILSLAPEELLVDAADVLGCVLVASAEIAVLIEIVVIVTYAGHSVKVIYIVIDEDLLNPDVICIAELNELVGRHELLEDQISAVALAELFDILGLALLVSISAVATGIEVFYKLFI